MSAALRTGNDNNHAPVTPRDTRSKCKAALARGSLLVLPAMAALGIGGPASAFELGALEVRSTLGQPLRASIAYALNPGEEIRSYCIYVSPGRSASGLPSAGPASVVVESGSIRLLGESAVNDPLLALQVTVDCPYAAHLSREYVAFVNPAEARPAAEPTARTRDQVRSAQPVATARPVADERVTRAPIAASTTYRVQPGDTLSGIAQRMTGRSVTIWQAVDALFAANPDAFIGGNRDFLKAGALLRVPDAIYTADGGAIVARPVAQPAPVETPAAPGRHEPESTPYSGYRSEAARIESGRAARAADATAPAPDAGSSLPEPAAAAEPIATDTREPSPVRDIRAADGPFVEPAERARETAAAPVESPPAAILPESRPGVPFEAPLSRAPAESGGAWSWLIWLGGSGSALILALLLLGRPLRKRFGGEAERPLGDDGADRDRDSSPATVVSTPEPLPDTSGLEVDFHFDEAEADARLIRLDGDVEDGTGFQDGEEIDVAQDFGFTASGGIELGLDVEFPEEPATVADEDTNVIPPMRREGDVIVENEVPPESEETGAYDVSMIVDATQQPISEGDDTTRDLHAIELDTDETEPDEDPYTLSREVDYKILEQDYQDELTATQALDAELSNAARALAERLGGVDSVLPDSPTAEFPALGSDATVPHPAARALAEADTVEMPAKTGDDLEDTGVNEELKDLPSAVNDPTAEMEIESATVDTKKMKVS